MRLPESQLAVLEAASATESISVDRLADNTGLKPETVTRAAFDLRDDGLVSIDETVQTSAELTAEATEYLEDGLPEVRLYRAAIDAGADTEPVQMGQLIGASGLAGPQVNIALSNFARKGYGSIDSGAVSADPDADPDTDPEHNALAGLADGETVADEDILAQLERRDLIVRSEQTVRSVTLTDDAVTALMEGIEVAETVDRLTPEMLTSGEWDDVEFTEYNVAADAPSIEGGRKHILRQTADRVKDVLVGMGFKEMEGPHADADFWINDCLFMPQDHPARTHWDRFALDVPPIQSVPEDLVERVEDAHRNGVGEDGDGYHSPWSRDFAEAIALRGHTTSLSMRYLSGYAGADIEPPKRYSPSRRCTETIRLIQHTCLSSSRSKDGSWLRISQSVISWGRSRSSTHSSVLLTSSLSRTTTRTQSHRSNCLGHTPQPVSLLKSEIRGCSVQKCLSRLALSAM